MSTQKMAGEFISSLMVPHVDPVNERIQAGDNRALLRFPFALALDLVDLPTGFITRKPLIYRFNRELGFSRRQALKHTELDTALAAAAIVLTTEIHPV